MIYQRFIPEKILIEEHFKINTQNNQIVSPEK